MAEEKITTLEEVAEEWAENEAYGKSDAEFEMAYKGFIAGAEWQKEQMPSDEEMKCALRMEYEKGVFDTKQQMIRDCSVQASYEAEIEKAEERGYNLCKEQMMKDAVERTVKIDSGGYPYIDITAELYDYEHDVPLAKEGELVKIIIIPEKED